MDTVIVAIPFEQDYVWNISSETTPHLTLLVLGDDPNNLQQIVEFVEHATQNSSLCRFGLSVDRRDVLGDNEADVLFFTKDWCIEKLMNFRSYLLQDPNIKTAYDSVDQFPEWLPHLTLGYPETPAKKDERDNPGFSWIQFDKIAVWTEDYSGPEFNLKSSYGLEVSMSDLQHFGVKGMHWGVRSNAKNDYRIKTARANLPMSRHNLKIAKKQYKTIDKAQYRFDKTNVGKAQAKLILKKNGKIPLSIMKKNHKETLKLARKETSDERYVRKMKTPVLNIASIKT